MIAVIRRAQPKLVAGRYNVRSLRPYDGGDLLLSLQWAVGTWQQRLVKPPVRDFLVAFQTGRELDRLHSRRHRGFAIHRYNTKDRYSRA